MTHASPLICFTKYTPAGASSRYRTYQYLPALQAAGFAVQVSPLFDEAYLAHKYATGRAPLWRVLILLLKRVWQVLSMPRGQRVLIEYELFPYAPAWFERWLRWRGCQLFVDYDDALFHQYDAHPNRWVRRWLGDKIATVMRLAHIVIAGNEYLADYARQAGAPRVAHLPTVIDLTHYPMTRRPEGTGPLVIGWIGSPSTAPYVSQVAEALTTVCRSADVKVCLVGSGPVVWPDLSLDIVPWSAAGEVPAIECFDIGIMPLPDAPWARGKCGFKLIQYMACGLPVVASPVGVNQQLVTPGINGFLATTTAEWVTALTSLLADASLRRRLGQAGRARVEQAYCLQVTAPRLVEILRGAA